MNRIIQQFVQFVNKILNKYSRFFSIYIVNTKIHA